MNTQKSPLIVYLDEAGDHSLESIDASFPVFVLALFICDIETYSEKIVPAAYRFKFDFFGHEGIILHSRDIRKAQKEFGFLTDKTKREEFYIRINALMSQLDYTLLSVVIHKQRHKARYKWPENPYDLALKFAMERLIVLLEEKGQTDVHLIAEARGKKEDDDLRRAFLDITSVGTGYMPLQRFEKIKFRLLFRKKEANIIGTQMADLAAYPIARYILETSKPNPAYEILRGKFYKGEGWGVKLFP